jgi:hypothetical protein
MVPPARAALIRNRHRAIGASWLRPTTRVCYRPFTMTRLGRALLTLAGGAFLALGCTGTTPRDKQFGQDADSTFMPPLPEAGPDTPGAADAPASADTDDAGSAAAGSGGAAGAAAGAGGDAGDAGADVSDGGDA